MPPGYKRKVAEVRASELLDKLLAECNLAHASSFVDRYRKAHAVLANYDECASEFVRGDEKDEQNPVLAALQRLAREAGLVRAEPTPAEGAGSIPVDDCGNPLPPTNEVTAKAIVREIAERYPFRVAGRSLGDWLDDLRVHDPVELTRRLAALYSWAGVPPDRNGGRAPHSPKLRFTSAELLAAGLAPASELEATKAKLYDEAFHAFTIESDVTETNPVLAALRRITAAAATLSEEKKTLLAALKKHNISPLDGWPPCATCGKSIREGNHDTELGGGHEYVPKEEKTL